MIKKMLTHKLTSAASSECVIIGLKLTDAEAHAFRLAGLFLFLISIVALIYDWHHKAHTETSSLSSAPVAPVTRKTKRNRKHRARR